MAKTFLPGIGEIETSGKGLSSDEFDVLKSAVDYRKSVDNTGFEALTPDILLEQEIEIEGESVKVDIPMTVGFFWPNIGR